MVKFMKKFENILIISDIDGTLVDETWKISEENIRAAQYFMDNGGTFTYATGRQAPVAAGIVSQLTPNAPVICYNGAAIYDYRTEEYLWTSPIDPSCKVIINDILKNCSVVNVEINTAGGIYTLKDVDYTIKRYEKFSPFFEKTDSIESVGGPWLKIVVVTKPEDMAALRNRVQSHPNYKDFQFSQSADFLYEFLNPNINKGTTLPVLRNILGNEYKVIALGDNENDIDLLKNADIGFAVADGSPMLLEHCKNLTAPLYGHALVDIVNKIDKGLV